MSEQVKDENGLVIDASNFRDYFFDVRRYGPKPGQVMAKFSAVAVFGAGPEKLDLIKVLKTDKARQAAMVMRKIHCAREPDCYRVCREICEDLAKGMSDAEVNKKEYEFVLEAYFYTKREYVPKGDPNWELIDLVKYDPETGTFKVNIELTEPPKISASDDKYQHE
jgi:hypothetical protein